MYGQGPAIRRLHSQSAYGRVAVAWQALSGGGLREVTWGGGGGHVRSATCISASMGDILALVGTEWQWMAHRDNGSGWHRETGWHAGSLILQGDMSLTWHSGVSVTHQVHLNLKDYRSQSFDIR